MLLQLLPCLLSLLFLSGPVDPCGVTVHTEIGKRALDLYENDGFGQGEVRRILEENQDAFQAGIPFPDFFYNPLCGDHHDVAEDAHWGPYLKVAVDYFRETYPAPFAGNDDAEKLFAFLYGVAIHQTSDTSWHALEGLTQGIIHMVAEVEYGGDYGSAHTLMDNGGDIAGAYLFDMSYADQWYIPSEDLYNILIRYQGDDDGLTPESFETCGAWIHLLRSAEELEAAALLYPSVAESSPALLDELEMYVSGSMDDMTSWSRLVWDTLTTMMVDGTDDCTITDNPMTIECSQATPKRKTDGAGKNRQKSIGHSTMFDGHKKLDTGNIEIIKTAKGAYVKNKTVADNSNRAKSQRAKVGGVGDINLYSSRPYSELGYSMSASNDVLAIGAPGYIRSAGDHRQGCVFLLYRPLEFLSGDVDVESAASQVVCEEDEAEAYSRFGQSVAVVDFTGDGIDDLVVGASATGSTSFEYSGRLLVYLGLAQGIFASTPSYVVLPDPSGDNEYASFGTAVEVMPDGIFASAKHFMADGMEQVGKVSSVLKDTDTPGVLGQGSLGFDWFGHTMASFSTEDETTLLAVGAPTSAVCASGQECYSSPGKVMLLDSQGNILAELHGRQDLERFGYAVEIGPALVNGASVDVLLVGASFSTTDESHTGAVYVFNLEEVLAEEQPEPVAVVEGNVQNGRFGSRLSLLFDDALMDTNDKAFGYLAIGSPRHHDGAFFNAKEPGAVFIYADLAEPAIMTVEGEELSFFGGGDVIQVPSDNDIWVAAGAIADSSFGIRRGGSISLWTV